MVLLSVDIGTSVTKSVLFNETGEIIASSYQEYNRFIPVPAGPKWTHKSSGQPSGKRCGPSPANTAIRNGILTQDSRATEEAAMVLDTIGETSYFKIRGSRPRAVTGLCKILWLKKHEPNTFRQTWKFMTFSDYLRTRLGFPAIIDYATAASSLPYDIRKQDYSDTLLLEFGLKRAMFSETAPSDNVLGEIGLEARTELGLPKGVKLVIGGYDAHCGILGAGITQSTPQIMADIAGTFERVACIKTKPALTQKALKNDINSNCYLFKDAYVISSALATSGSIVRWFHNELESAKEKDKANTYNTMFAPLNFDGGTMMTIPYFAGSSGDSFAKGAFLGLTLGTNRQQMLQAVVEGTTHEMKVLVDRLDELSDTPYDIIRAFGGPAKSPKRLQLKADISGKKVEAPAVEEASALGAAIIAGVATGVFYSYEQAIKAAVKIKATYQPRPEIHQIYKRQHEIFKHLVKTLIAIAKSIGLY